MKKRYLPMALLGMALCWAPHGQAATIAVDAEGGGDVASLAEAVDQALGNGEADEIVIAPGVYPISRDAGGVLALIGEDELVIRGEDASDRPVIVIEPNMAQPADDETVDGLIIRMDGSLTFQDVIFAPGDAFSLDPDVDDLIAVQDFGTADAPASLDLSFINVLITHAESDFTPVSMDGWTDPAGAFFFTRDDALNIDATGGDAINLLLEDTIIAASGDGDAADGVVLDGPNISCTLTGETRITYPSRYGFFAFDTASVNIEGTADTPIIVYAASSFSFNVRGGENSFDHLWLIGAEQEDGSLSDFGVRFDANTSGSLTMTNSIVANMELDGMFFNFDGEDYSYTIQDCTFYNVPTVLRLGFVGVDPAPSDAQTFNFTDNIYVAADAVGAGGDFFTPEPTVIDYGDPAISSVVNIENLALNGGGVTSSRSAQSPNTAENILEDADLQFAATEFVPGDFGDYLVVTNCDLVAGQASEGRALDGARPSECGTALDQWFLHNE